MSCPHDVAQRLWRPPVVSPRAATTTTLSIRGPRPPRRALARDLPETAVRVASRCPAANLSTATLTGAGVWAREVVHSVVNRPRIDGKDGVAGSIPAGGSTSNQQLRPGPAPGLLHAPKSPVSEPPLARDLPENVVRSCQTTQGDRLIDSLSVSSAAWIGTAGRA